MAAGQKKEEREREEEEDEEEGGGSVPPRATPIISCSGWARRRRQTSTCRLRPGGRSLPRCPSALWEDSAGGSSDPVGRREASALEQIQTTELL